MAKPKTFRTAIGGQALIEGIMMRGPEKTAAVARRPDGVMVFRESKTPSPKEICPIFGWVLIRGVINFVSSLKAGMDALTWSAEFFPEEENEKPTKFDRWIEKNGKSVEKMITGISMVLALVLAVALFTVLPTLIGGWLGLEDGPLRNVAETGIRLVILLLYMMLVSLMKDIQRTFAYHGAEHKTIACYEAGQELTADNVRGHTRFHPRCGTSFLLMVVLVSMLAFLLASTILPFLPWENTLLRVLMRLALLPLVVSISYEINRLVGRYDNLLTKILRAPGLWLQRITTREPDDGMIEVGIEALRRVLPDEEGLDEWGKE